MPKPQLGTDTVTTCPSKDCVYDDANERTALHNRAPRNAASREQLRESLFGPSNPGQSAVVSKCGLKAGGRVWCKFGKYAKKGLLPWQN